MSNQEIDERTIKELAIDTLKIANCNLLLSIQGLNPDEFIKQISQNINPIIWIFGHCISQMDHWFGIWCQGKGVLPGTLAWDKEDSHLRFGTPKTRVNEFPDKISPHDLIEYYLQISEQSINYLQKLPEEKFRLPPEGYPYEQGDSESIFEGIQRVALHFLGHSGQILLIRKELGNQGGYFVRGISDSSRKELLLEWMTWWKNNKSQFH